MASATSVDKAESVEAVISLVRPTGCPGRGLAPFSKGRGVWMGRGEAIHGAWIRLAGRRVDILSERQFVEVARIGDDENWRIIPPAPPFLAVGRDDADRHAFNPSHNIGSIRVPDRYGEPADNGITARDQHGRDRISGSRSIGVEHPGEAHALGMV